MKHFILTRFNVRSAGREQRLVSDPEWLSHRFELFERFTVPSIRHQSNPDFTWLVFFDKSTPESFRQRLASYRLPNLNAVYVDTLPLTDVISIVHGLTPATEDCVITTRLDNDDAIADDFIARIQQAASTREGRFFLNFDNGFIFHNGALFRHADPSNAFASLCEPPDTLTTVWTVPHTELARLAPIVQLDGSEAWLQVVHARNVSNRIRGRLVGPETGQPHFPADISALFRAQSRLRIANDAFLLYPTRVVRDWGVRMAKRLLRVKAVR